MTYYFDCGLPRSGSTLLGSLLNQNPQIHAGPLSPVFETMYYTDATLKKEQAKAFPKPEIFSKMVRNVIDEYYSDVDEPIIVDRCRAWPAHIDLIKEHITESPKLICTVRHPLEILSSFIDLINTSRSVSFIDRAMLDKGLIVNDTNRCHFMMNPGGIVWESMNALATAFRKKQTEYIYFVQYDDLISDPQKELNNLHKFLGIESYEYDLEHIENKYRENDKEVYGLPKMHEVRKKVEKTSRHYSEVLSEEVINKYKNMDFWNR